MKIIKLTNGKDALVDDDMYEQLKNYTWFEMQGHAATKIHYEIYMMHRMVKHVMDSSLDVHHIDENKLNNQAVNLLTLTKTQHGHYKKGFGKSPYRGVSQIKKTGRWQARARVTGVTYKHIGCFITQEQAAKAYDEFVYKLNPHAKLNFPLCQATTPSTSSTDESSSSPSKTE